MAQWPPRDRAIGKINHLRREGRQGAAQAEEARALPSENSDPIELPHLRSFR